ncbi:uncharacterized protein BJ212DRAFT_1479672 [Suillus subaureus]|uniref:Uncharacterized protein n=1 Tax=Suillus subaureus TaxID=48587 RepID=A0A9P7EDG4_9AGAM|nr:uncharacterized protein BJ212DRAFT_1479672 [Suillus subaureus]KAG1818682.1 hypothetical protein BJ212DRAFT_1479672 [Suillus subaureus]
MPREFVGQLNEQADEIEYQTGRIKDLEASHARLEASNEEISATLQRHLAVLLDDARPLLGNR